METLRLLAIDPDDLTIVSAHCQDAIIQASDMAYRKQAEQFVIQMNRFVWEKTTAKTRFNPFAAPQYERRRAVLHFNRVMGVRYSNIDWERNGQTLVLLTVRFAPGDAPSGVIELVFAGGSAIRLDVEVIEVQLTDIGGAWSTDNRPRHSEKDASL